jgi:chemotaxis protein MotB
MLGKKQAPSGAPEWVLTYGDMMSLLLCFFILLAAFADFEAGGGQESVKEAIKSIQEALGAQSPMTTATNQIDFRDLLRKLEALARQDNQKNYGDADEKGIYGKSFRLRKLRDGMEIIVGGPIVFEPFSAEINADGKQALLQIAESLKGHRNRIEVRGHAAENPHPPDWSDDDAVELSFRRAKAVADELILRGVDRRALVWTAVGQNEPIARGVYDAARRAQARRVEIIVRESLVDDYLKAADESNESQPSATTAPAAATQPGI